MLKSSNNTKRPSSGKRFSGAHVKHVNKHKSEAVYRGQGR